MAKPEMVKQQWRNEADDEGQEAYVKWRQGGVDDEEGNEEHPRRRRSPPRLHLASSSPLPLTQPPPQRDPNLAHKLPHPPPRLLFSPPLLSPLYV
ncbi:hypothetical protein QVD17_24719 [Tagetes erecta]|uniref:Uncharacterized protein n=1 Tax=Tagetes erecta TaxID=13708 RepID=A0AAD8KLV3_TARER|nr:hypothetical protein QVD17_24719 [Tagetes erecta]